MPGVIAQPQPAEKARKPTKNELRRAKKKQQKQAAATDTEPAQTIDVIKPEPIDTKRPLEPAPPASTDPIQDVPSIVNEDDPLYDQFKDIFAKFQEAEEDAANGGNEGAVSDKPEVFYDDDDNIQDEDEEEETKERLSRKARKAASKLSVAELKAIVRKPEVVEWTDTSAQDPKLLVNIKSARNVVPVPAHWSLKREYLSSKRGVEKAGFVLPQFIAETGIADMRDAVLEKQAEATLKQRQRERVQGKVGKLDIDYQKLYEAFFKRQTKPSLSRLGEVYYEGKEHETNLRHLKPGDLSDELKEALNMPPGAPPPWLISMQKIGPPPSYPALKIPGLNVPPPPGGQWGFHPGGYGKPPLDEHNKPLWGGDVFGLGDGGDDSAQREEPVDKTLWGELQPLIDEEDEEEEDEDEDEEEEGDGDEDADLPPGAKTDVRGGFQSTVPTDLGTQTNSGEFNLRKQQRRGTETDAASHPSQGPPRSAGQVLQERSIRSEGFFGGERAYDLSERSHAPSNLENLETRDDDRGRKRKVGDLDVSVDVEALQRDDRLSKDEIRRQYETQRQQEGAGGWKGVVDQEDLSQMIAEESAKRQKRDAEREKGRRGR